MSSYRENTDTELLTLLREGCEAAFVEVYRRHWRKMYNAAYKRLQDTAQCEDLVQNIFTDLWERRAELEIGNLSAYLLTAVKFQVLKISTRSGETHRFVDILDTTLISTLQSDSPLIEQELAELVKLWIAALPEKRRKIFLMHFVEEIGSDRIADALGLSQKTVQNQLALATSSLRSHLFKTLLLILVLEPGWPGH